MRKPFSIAAATIAAGLMVAGISRAQQTPAPAPKPASPAATQQPAAKSQTPATAAKKTPTAKTGTGATSKTQTPLALKTPKDKASYAIGLNIGKSLHRDGVDIDPAVFLRGIKDALAGGKTLLTDQEVQSALTDLQNGLRKKQEEMALVLGDTNKKEGDAFLAANKAKDGIVTLPDGLQYKILKEGTGPKPAATDSVVCNYRGTFLSGAEFDSSAKHGQPATFPVNGVIKGWTEALQLMPVGSKWQLFVPGDLAYGQRGAGPGSGIGPNATLIFEVELLSIQAKDTK